MADSIEDLLSKIRLGGKAPKPERQSIENSLREMGVLPPIDAGKTIIKAEDLGLATRAELASNPETLAPAPVSPSPRADGSIAGRYNPEVNMPGPRGDLAAVQSVEPDAQRALDIAKERGVRTVSSGYDAERGVGWVIGEDAEGNTVRIESEPEFRDTDGAALANILNPKPVEKPKEFAVEPAMDADGAVLGNLLAPPELPPAPPELVKSLEDSVLDRYLYGKPIPAGLRAPGVPAEQYDFTPEIRESFRREAINLRNAGMPFPQIMERIQKLNSIPVPLIDEIEKMQAAGLPYSDIKFAYDAILRDMEAAEAQNKETGAQVFYDVLSGAKYTHNPAQVKTSDGKFLDLTQFPSPNQKRLDYQDDLPVIDLIDQTMLDRQKLPKEEKDYRKFLKTNEARQIIVGLVGKAKVFEDATHEAVVERMLPDIPGLRQMVQYVGYPLTRGGIETVKAFSLGLVDVDYLARLAGTEEMARAQREAAGVPGRVAEGVGMAAGTSLAALLGGGAVAAGALGLAKLGLKTELAAAGAAIRGGTTLGTAALGTAGAAMRNVAGAVNLIKGPLTFSTVSVGQQLIDNLKNGKPATQQLDDAAVEGAKNGLYMGLLQLGNAAILSGVKPGFVKNLIAETATGAELMALTNPEAFKDPALIAGMLPVFSLMGKLSKSPDFRPQYRPDLFSSTPTLRSFIDAKIKETGATSAKQIDDISKAEYARLVNIWRDPTGHSDSDVIAAKTFMNEYLTAQLGTAGVGNLPELSVKTTLGNVWNKIIAQATTARARAGNEFAALLREHKATTRALTLQLTNAAHQEYGAMPPEVKKQFLAAAASGQESVTYKGRKYNLAEVLNPGEVISDSFRNAAEEIAKMAMTGERPKDKLVASAFEEKFRTTLARIRQATDLNQQDRLGAEKALLEQGVIRQLNQLYLAKKLGIQRTMPKPPEIAASPQANALWDKLSNPNTSLDAFHMNIMTIRSEKLLAKALATRMTRPGMPDLTRFANWEENFRTAFPDVGGNELVEAVKNFIARNANLEYPKLRESFAREFGTRIDDFYSEANRDRMNTFARGGQADFAERLLFQLYNAPQHFSLNEGKKVPLIVDENFRTRLINTHPRDLSPEMRDLRDRLLTYQPVKDGLVGNHLENIAVSPLIIDDLKLASQMNPLYEGVSKAVRTAKITYSLGGLIRDASNNIRYLAMDLGKDFWKAFRTPKNDNLPSIVEIHRLGRAMNEGFLREHGGFINSLLDEVSGKKNGWRSDSFDKLIIDNLYQALPLFDSLPPELTQPYLKRFGARDFPAEDARYVEGRSRLPVGMREALDLQRHEALAPGDKAVRVAAASNLIRDMVILEHMKRNGTIGTSYFETELKFNAIDPQKDTITDAELRELGAQLVGSGVIKAPPEKAMKGPMTIGEKAHQAATYARALPDNLTKGGAYLAWLDSGMLPTKDGIGAGVSLDEISSRIAERYPNYDQVPKGISALGRYTGGFGANFFAEDMRIHYQTAKNNPVRWATLHLGVPLALQQLFKAVSDTSDEELQELRKKYGYYVLPISKDDQGNRGVIDFTNAFNTEWLQNSIVRPGPAQPIDLAQIPKLQLIGEPMPSATFGEPMPLGFGRRQTAIPPQTIGSDLAMRLKPFVEPFLADNILGTFFNYLEGRDQFGEDIPDDERLRAAMKYFTPAIVQQATQVVAGERTAPFSLEPKPSLGLKQTGIESFMFRLKQLGAPTAAFNPKRREVELGILLSAATKEYKGRARKLATSGMPADKIAQQQQDMAREYEQIFVEIQKQIEQLRASQK